VDCLVSLRAAFDRSGRLADSSARARGTALALLHAAGRCVRPPACDADPRSRAVARSASRRGAATCCGAAPRARAVAPARSQRPRSSRLRGCSQIEGGCTLSRSPTDAMWGCERPVETPSRAERRRGHFFNAMARRRDDRNEQLIKRQARSRRGLAPRVRAGIGDCSGLDASHAAVWPLRELTSAGTDLCGKRCPATFAAGW
jgi:hypothetical protein